ncbi:MAG: hypothetical protein J6V66_06670 [Clostridia bacterium]|nr:hypothetical protein [Clostridia bacterium]
MGIKDNTTLNAKIGGYKLPADFKCLNTNFLGSLEDLSFAERLASIYKFVLGKNLPNGLVERFDSDEFLANVLSVDDKISVLELFGGETCSYNDFIFDKSSFEMEICSLAFVIVSDYVDLAEGGVINLGEKINVGAQVCDGKLLLAMHFCTLIKLPINTLIFGTDKPVDETFKNMFFATPKSGEVDEITNAFFEETEYLFDPVSAGGLVAYDIFYDDYEDDLETLIISLYSPYLFSRALLKTLTGINELSVDKAIKKLSEFTALEVPNCIESGFLAPFYKNLSEISVKDALEIIKG